MTNLPSSLTVWVSIIFAVFLAGCSLNYTNLAAGQQAPHYRIWPHPANGDFLCLTSMPGSPIHGGADAPGQIVGYTGAVVAFAGIQNEHRLAIQQDNGILGYVDDTAVKAFQPAYPGQACIVTRDLNQHPC